MTRRTGAGYKQQFRGSEDQKQARETLYRLWRSHSIPDDQLLQNLGLFIRSGALAKIFFLNELHERVLNLPGAIVEFGVWWGQSLAVFQNLRAMHEPYHNRLVVGFDTFEGYPEPGKHDRPSETIKQGGYTTTGGYEAFLSELLAYHDAENVLSQFRKFELVKGDVCKTAQPFFDGRPEMLVALAFFDMALYEPTKAAIEAVLPRIVKGGILAFDELNDPDYPGETEAVIETIGLRQYRIERSRFLPARTIVTIA